MIDDARPAAAPPLFTPREATALLDQVLYDRVLACIDMDALYELEHTLASTISDLHGQPYPQAAETTRVVLDPYLDRLPDEIRRYLRAGPFLRFDPFDPVARCEDGPPPRPIRRVTS